jgi:hypothetical protein
MLAEIDNGVWVAAMNGVQQIFGLMSQLFKVRTDGKVATCHDGPPLWSCPWSAVQGEKGDS